MSFLRVCLPRLSKRCRRGLMPMLLVTASSVLSGRALAGDDGLDCARAHAENVIRHCRDRYGAKHTPLLVCQLDIVTKTLPPATSKLYAVAHYYRDGWFVCGPPSVARYRDKTVDVWRTCSNRGGSDDLALAVLRVHLAAAGKADCADDDPNAHF